MGESRAMLKRAALILLQLTVTAAGIFYVFHDPEKREQMGEALHAADWRWLALGWLCYGMVEILATVRWQMLLRVQGVVLRWWRTGAIVVIGLFFNMFLPGLVGGDAMRLYFVFKEVPRKKARATLSVAMDRLLGLWSILFLAVAVVLLRLDWLRQSPATAHIVYFALALLGGISLLVFLLLGAVAFRLLPTLPKHTPFRKALLEGGRALHLYRTHLRIIGFGFLLTLASHLLYYLSFFCAARALAGPAGARPTVSDFFSIMPLVNTITGIPISFGGVGIRETLFQTLLGQLAHIPAAVAALSASLGYVIQASWGLVGGAAYLLWRARADDPADNKRRAARARPTRRSTR
jgi:uncharacterized protein (TIRG00374 family)